VSLKVTHQITDLLLQKLDRLRYPPIKVSRLTYVEKDVAPKIIPNYQQKIPLKVWQTWKTAHLPLRIARTVRRFRNNNPEYTHRLLTDLECSQFIEEHFGGTRTEQAYFRINPAFGAARADFWRYCILFKYGGIYLDIDSTCVTPLRNIISGDDSAVLSQEKNLVDAWRADLSILNESAFLAKPPTTLLERPGNVFLQWFLIFTPKHPLLEAVIDNVTDAVLKYREFSPNDRPGGHARTIYLTGPLRFTDTIWKALAADPELINNLRIDGIDFQGKAIFQFPGHAEKDQQCVHYRQLSAPIVSPYLE
jgi:mannosyltransferase OCH1-like enzyme